MKPGLDRRTPEINKLSDFDKDYFTEIEGKEAWIAIGQENCRNQQYFTVKDKSGENLGIIGVYDTDDDKNISHTVVDPRFRGLGLAAQFKKHLMQKLDLQFITMTIDLDNRSSIRAAEKLEGAKRVSDAKYEEEFHKAKYILEKTSFDS